MKESLDLSSLLKDRQDLRSFGLLEAELEAKGTSGMVEVTGELTLDVEMSCSRCLDPVRETLSIPFRELFAGSAELLPAEEVDDAHIVTEDKVELTPYLEEAVVLALPYAPLCGEECQGLCPVCGSNRNDNPCECKVERIDPRLAGLADFFKQP
ncbi:DUF177 domain-containing protein [Paenibacillus sp. J2TS4]|uniref:YceD family protein n=1 Tax=Paenibacillus sp. J2TS4 TaxID=2807194 RepID=UPI0020BDA5F5|nr:DUF177 domain-containing protein [Paenibacillus sp. J2TS4]